jgi:poly(A) polymerase
MLKRIRKLFGRRAADSAAPVAPAGAVASAAPQAQPERTPPVHVGPRVVHQPISRSSLDPEAVKIIQRLTRFDHHAYLVGGCVRDLLLEREPKDFDIGTSATPRQIKRLFRNCRIIGRRFRLAHIYFQSGKIIEVATFRAQDEQDGAPADSEARDLLIRDDNVFGTEEQDALRRDFTINSLFYDVNNETVLDHADGLGDLRRRLVRTIGDPDVRFREDPIRILRAIKFAARLDFQIEPRTLAALERTRQEIPRAAAPRILEELNRFCRGGAARRSFELLRETGVLEVLLPEVARHAAASPDSWDFLRELLGQLDASLSTQPRDVRTGEILAAMLAWPVAERSGWLRAPTPVPAAEIAQYVQEELAPIAQRLRASRRDQEQCRQILGTLLRMVPARRSGRSSRRSQRGAAVAEALGILEVFGRRLDGEFAAAHELWSAPGAMPGPPAREELREPGEGDGQPRGRGRRRRRRPRDSPDKPAVRPARAEEPGMPPPWDDRYFFAALPSVPDLPGGDLAGDRYGASAPSAIRSPAEEVSGAVAVAPSDSSSSSSSSAEDPRPRRRRRSRRGGRRRSSRPRPPGDGAGGSEPEGGESETPS